MIEKWREVPSLPGVRASSLGRILLPHSFAKMPNGGHRGYATRPTEGSVTSASKNAAHLYRCVYSRKFGNIKIHRAVCEAFHGPPPFEGAVVIHINEDALDNRPENLKWGTQKENLNMPKIKEYHKSRTGENSPRRKHLLRNQSLT